MMEEVSSSSDENDPLVTGAPAVSGEGDDLYDDEADDRDATFADARRTSQLSDATLACPCCFTTLCYECQQHVAFKNQFRALTVINVRVKQDQQLVYEDEVYAPVCCSACGYECAVVGPGEEQMFHFHDVLASDPQ